MTNVFFVADDAIIDRVTDVVEGAVVVPAGIAVTVKALADKGGDNVTVTVHREICARRVEGSGEIAGRRVDIDLLHRVGIGGSWQ